MKHEIIDNVDYPVGAKLNQMIPKSTKFLYAGIGYFLGSGYKMIQENLLSIAQNGAEVKIVAGNLYEYNYRGENVINQSLDTGTYEILVDLYERQNRNIQIKTLKDNFFHGKFFFGGNEEESYLLSGSSNLSKKALSQNGNVEYNLFVEGEINGSFTADNKDWFDKIWARSHYLTADNVEEMRFIIQKRMFGVDVEDAVHAGGERKEKDLNAIQTEIVSQMLNRMGINTPEKTGDLKSVAVLNIYSALLEHPLGFVDAETVVEHIFTGARRDEWIGVVKEDISRSELTDYYYSLVKTLLKKEDLSGGKPDWSTVVLNGAQLFKIYYEKFHKKEPRQNRVSPEKKDKAIALLEKKGSSAFSFKEPAEVTDTAFEVLLRASEDIRGGFSDEWLYQFQSHDAKTLLDRFNYRQKGMYIAHETGMGKSPILAKFIKEVLNSKKETRILIACPASLLYQWAEDNLESDFGISAQIVEADTLRAYGSDVWAKRKVNIVSIDFLKNAVGETKRKEDPDVVAMSPDILIIDEAHNLKNGGAMRFKNISKLSPRFVVLASATPIQNNVKEFLVQLSLIDDEIDLSKAGDMEYVKRMRDKYLIRRTKESQLIEGDAVRQTERKVRDIQVGGTEKFRAVFLSLKKTLEENAFHFYSLLSKLKGACRTDVTGAEITTLTFLHQMTGSSHACIEGLKSLQRRITYLLEVDQDTLNEESVSSADGRDRKQMMGLVLNSKYKISENDKARLRQDISLIESFVDEKVGLLYENGEPLPNPKEGVVVGTIFNEKANGQLCIVFVRYRATGEALLLSLRRKGVSAAFFSGELTKRKRNELVHEFRDGKIQVLIATDTANAGLNLQTANFIINYDLNWNPMIVEQRAGRIHRVGQKSKEVVIWNLVLTGTIDEQVVGRMKGKIDRFDDFFDSSDQILGKITETYFSPKDLDNLSLPSGEVFVEEAELGEAIKENQEDIERLDFEYLFLKEASRTMLMWILKKYGLTYHTDDNENYLIKVLSSKEDPYLIDLKQVYNVIEKEDHYFKDFEISSHISNVRNKKAAQRLHETNICERVIGVEVATTKIDSLKLKKRARDLIVAFIERNRGKSILHLNLDVLYTLTDEDGTFYKREFRSVAVDSRNAVCSDADIVRVLSVLPDKSYQRESLEGLKSAGRYSFMYEDILPKHLSQEKEKELKEPRIKVSQVGVEICNVSLIRFV